MSGLHKRFKVCENEGLWGLQLCIGAAGCGGAAQASLLALHNFRHVTQRQKNVADVESSWHPTMNAGSRRVRMYIHTLSLDIRAVTLNASLTHGV